LKIVPVICRAAGIVQPEKRTSAGVPVKISVKFGSAGVGLILGIKANLSAVVYKNVIVNLIVSFGAVG
jgi:hypothetical protein